MVKPMPPKGGKAWLAFQEWFRTAPIDKKHAADIWRGFSAGWRMSNGEPPNVSYKGAEPAKRRHGEPAPFAPKVNLFSAKALADRNNLQKARRERTTAAHP